MWADFLYLLQARQTLYPLFFAAFFEAAFFSSVSGKNKVFGMTAKHCHYRTQHTYVCAVFAEP